MDFKKLSYLESVYRLKNFTKAAEEQFVSQPSITKAIVSLEEELGLTLIHRTNKSIVFTPEGELFMPHVYRILDTVNRAKEEMAELCQNQELFLNIELSSSAVAWLWPLIYTDFLPSHPEIKVSIHENTIKKMLASILDETSNIAFTLIPRTISDDYYVHKELCKAELCLVMTKNHPLSSYASVSLEKLDGETILTFPEGSLIQDTLSNITRKYGVYPNYLLASTQVSYTRKVISLGAGLTIAIANKIHHTAEEDNLVMKSFDPPIYFSEGLIYKKGKHKSKAMLDFINFVEDLLR